MVGHLVLEGGAEFGGGMREPDLRAIKLAGGPRVPIAILPTAAAPDRNHQRAGGNGARWFRHLGATKVDVVPVVDVASANRPDLAATLAKARLIYLLGGFTHYLGQTLKGSKAWEAMLAAYHRGAVLAGSSAGAMVLCQRYYVPEEGTLAEGLGLVPKALVLPHHNKVGNRWSPRLAQLAPEALLLGIDERTGMIDDGPKGTWRVYGEGSVTLYRGGAAESYGGGDAFPLTTSTEGSDDQA